MSQWYLIAYDVRCPRRMQRLHRRLKKSALAVQESVFLAELGRAARRRLVAELREVIDEREDDLRLYPAPHPARIWMSSERHAGASPSALAAPETAHWLAPLARAVAHGRAGARKLREALSGWQRRA